MKSSFRVAAIGIAALTLISGMALGQGAHSPVTTVVLIDGGKKVELKLDGEKVVNAKVDGKAVDLKNVTSTKDQLRIVDNDGNVLFENDGIKFGVAGLSSEKSATTLPGSRTATTLSRRGNDGAAGNAPGGKWDMSIMAVPPKTMLGVTLDHPEDQLAKHLGLDAADVTVITGVTANLPASKAGIAEFDLIVAIEGKTPAGPDDIRARLAQLNPGDKLGLSVIHQGQKKDVTVTVEAYDRTRLGDLLTRAMPAEKAEDMAQLDMMRALEGAGVGKMGDHNNLFRALSPTFKGKVIIERDVNGKTERTEKDFDGKNGGFGEIFELFAPGNDAPKDRNAHAGIPPVSPVPPLGPLPPIAPKAPRAGGGVFVLPRVQAEDAGSKERLERLEQQMNEIRQLLERMEKKGR